MQDLFLYSCLGTIIIGIGLISTSILFQQDSYGLLDEYANVSRISVDKRITYCNECIATGRCPYPEPNKCYQIEAETQAALIDYHVLIRASSNDYYGKYKSEYNFNSTEKGEAYITKQELRLKNYPKTWIQLCTVSIVCASIQLIVLIVGVSLTCCCQKKHHFIINKLWIIPLFIFFITFLIIFIFALVWSADTSCPGFAYQSKYGNDSECDKPYTYGVAFTGCLGTDMVLSFISLILVGRTVRQRMVKMNKGEQNQMTRIPKIIPFP